MGICSRLNGFSKSFAAAEDAGKDPANPLIALIIDDIGYSVHRARCFMALDIPMTFSILPRLASSQDLAIEIHEHGHEIMLHQPMEPCSAEFDPGPGAVYVGYENKKIQKIIEENISEIPFASGVNNHMGSKFTACRQEMTEALYTIKKQNLFFVDSMTSRTSTGFKTARALRMEASYRNVFLDNLQDETCIYLQLLRLKNYALRHGRAIGIGHPFKETAKAIERFATDFQGSGLSFVPVSRTLST